MRMQYTKSEVLDFIEENDVKFIKLAFCDIFGCQKVIAIQPALVPEALETGIPIDASRITGFEREHDSELFLVPDTSTMSLLPWRPVHGRVVRFYCDIRRADGSGFDIDCRGILKKAVDIAKLHGIIFNFGASSEFYLFKNDGEGNPTDVPFDNAGFMDAAPEDKGEDVRREICLTLEDMGVTPQSSHHSSGPGQNIIEFCHSSAVHAADDVITYKSVVKTMAAHNGLTASFDPIPISGKDGNGFHITLTPMLRDKDCSENFLAGILAHAAEITAILNPTADSYRRLGVFGAPEFVSWSEKSRRCFAYKKAGQPAIEVRSPDSTTNPYLAYAALIYAGLDGYLKRTKLPKPDAARETSEKLPKSAEEALQVFEKSSFIRNVFPEYFVRTFIQTFGCPRSGV
ncbi:MAG: glutamine synthetase family protein [Acutalibacteraceae bacterium]|nr:glutamine synthetase family protein [Acutalibacteraceae bacterium]